MVRNSLGSLTNGDRTPMSTISNTVGAMDYGHEGGNNGNLAVSRLKHPEKTSVISMTLIRILRL